MKKVFALIAVLVAGSIASAEGFKCETESGLAVKVYNHTMGATRTAAVMIISDTLVGAGNKTIAKFTNVQGNLDSKSATYVANVDLRFSDSSRKGELIAGTKLGELDTVVLDVDFSYAAPVAEGTEMAAELTLVKRNGQHIVEQAVCSRYLKN